MTLTMPSESQQLCLLPGKHKPNCLSVVDQDIKWMSGCGGATRIHHLPAVQVGLRGTPLLGIAPITSQVLSLTLLRPQFWGAHCIATLVSLLL